MGGILLVCTGNMCRSPIAERLIRDRLRRRFGGASDAVAVTSAGTQAPVGQPIWPLAAAELARRGVPAEHFASRALRPAMISRADLVLTATRAHRDEALLVAPTALHRVYTMKEAAWLLVGADRSDVPGSSLTQRVRGLSDLAKRRRGRVAPIPPQAMDIQDPIGADEFVFHRVTAEIEQALAIPLRLL